MPKKGGGDEEMATEEKLQAVIIASGFELEEAWKPLRCAAFYPSPSARARS